MLDLSSLRGRDVVLSRLRRGNRSGDRVPGPPSSTSGRDPRGVPAGSCTGTRHSSRAGPARGRGARPPPPEVTDAVVQVESAYNPNVVGAVGEIGLMQVRPETA